MDLTCTCGEISFIIFHDWLKVSFQFAWVNLRQRWLEGWQDESKLSQAKTSRVRITAKMVDVIGSPEFNRSLFGDSKALRLKTTGKILIYHDFIVDDDD